MEGYHTVLSMLLAVHRRLTAYDFETRKRRAEVVRAMFITDVNHTVRSMLLAVRRHLAAFGVEARHPAAEIMRAKQLCGITPCRPRHAPCSTPPTRCLRH